MLRSTSTFNRIYWLVALVLVMAAASAMLFFARQHTVPVANALSPANPVVDSHRTIDLGAGYRLELDETKGKIIAPPVMVKSGPQTLDLGAGYRLELDGANGKIVAPASPSAYYKRMDLGAGYVLEINGENGQVIAPSASGMDQPANAAAAANRTIDLGAGYKLVTGPQGGQIVAPSNPLKTTRPRLFKLTQGYKAAEGVSRGPSKGLG